jgi:hypothetical protein
MSWNFLGVNVAVYSRRAAGHLCSGSTTVRQQQERHDKQS